MSKPTLPQLCNRLADVLKDFQKEHGVTLHFVYTEPEGDQVGICISRLGERKTCTVEDYEIQP